VTVTAVPPGARGVRLAEAPTVTAVVASCRERRLLDACLASLLPQCREHGAAVVVARADTPEGVAELERAYPEVRFVPAPRDATIPQLRGQGLAEAEGDIVALTEDHCVAAPDWIAQLATAPRNSDVFGGTMGNARRDRALDWAAYFSEYGFFAGGGEPAREQPILTGANVAYRRRVIDHVVTLARRGEWENVVHSSLAANGSTFSFLTTAAVYQNDTYRFGDFCRNRYEHGRDYARRRLNGQGGLRRWLYLAASGALPFLLTARVAGAVTRADRRAFLRALPLTFAFLTAWAVGEAVGYLLGPAPEPAGAR
jgi:glycosyltransferase involved in cell wall biosynthesis